MNYDAFRKDPSLEELLRLRDADQRFGILRDTPQRNTPVFEDQQPFSKLREDEYQSQSRQFRQYTGERLRSVLGDNWSEKAAPILMTEMHPRYQHENADPNGQFFVSVEKMEQLIITLRDRQIRERDRTKAANAAALEGVKALMVLPEPGNISTTGPDVTIRVRGSLNEGQTPGDFLREYYRINGVDLPAIEERTRPSYDFRAEQNGHAANGDKNGKHRLGTITMKIPRQPFLDYVQQLNGGQQIPLDELRPRTTGMEAEQASWATR
jgi:hypothetical protein